MTLEQNSRLPESKQTKAARLDGTAAADVPLSLPDRSRIPAGSVDITGIVPEGVHIDTDITEGHPGYEESGYSEVIPLERLRGHEDPKQ